MVYQSTTELRDEGRARGTMTPRVRCALAEMLEWMAGRAVVRSVEDGGGVEAVITVSGSDLVRMEELIGIYRGGGGGGRAAARLFAR